MSSGSPNGADTGKPSALKFNGESDHAAARTMPSDVTTEEAQSRSASRAEQSLRTNNESPAPHLSGVPHSNAASDVENQGEASAFPANGGRQGRSNSYRQGSKPTSFVAPPTYSPTNGPANANNNKASNNPNVPDSPAMAANDFSGANIPHSSKVSRRSSVVSSLPGPQKPYVDPLEAADDKETKKNEGKTRKIQVLNHEAHSPPFADNCIKTTKYTVNPFSVHFFIWKNLFEQFQRKANLYFLVIGCCQLIPGVSPTGQYTTLLTLIAVVVFSMLKAGYEDYQRFLKDAETNSNVAYVLREVPINGPTDLSGNTKKAQKLAPGVPPPPTVPRFVQIKYTDVRVGDVVRVLNVDNASNVRNNALPCDLMLLSSADMEGAAFVETSNLDGETNLKPRYCIDALKLSSDNVINFQSYSGNQLNGSTGGPASTDLGAGANTVYGVPALATKEDLIFTANVMSADFSAPPAVAGHPGETPHSNPLGSNNRMPSTAIQCWQRYQNCRIECEVPNGHLYTFSGNFISSEGIKYSITPAQMMYRGTSLRKVHWVVGVCINTGAETKVMMNARAPPHKASRVESLVNWLLIAVLLLQLILVLICAIVITLMPEDEWYLGDNSKGAFLTFVLGFVTFAILFNNLIPISLYVSMEMIKFFQGRLMEWDLCMYYPAKDMRATAKTTDLNEELGQINYIFSDKTGTLTCNVMTFMKFCCDGIIYGTGVTEIGRAAAKRRGETVIDTRTEEVLKSDFPFFDERISNEKWWTENNSEQMRKFFTALAVCHTVVIDQGRFEAESPDEEALVKAAKALGIRFKSRNSDTIALDVGTSGAEEEYTILEVIPFDSDRKRMSVLVKLPKGKGYKVITKGADNVMLQRMKKDHAGSFQHQAATVAALRQFGEEGLRVLVLAEKTLLESEALNWSADYRIAREIIGDDVRRDELLVQLATKVESDMTLIGVSAIEDKLQEGVPQAMEAFRAGGIKVWMLTGDKVETAINIGYACSLLFTDCRLTTYFGDTEADELAKAFDQDTSKPGDVKPHSVVIDGDALTTVLADEDLRERFYQMVRHCTSVVCCRVSPKQKAMVVNLIREKEASCVSLSIGDGANDVPMIQSAHVGVGISGMEGQQAANAADYSIGQFRFLQRLLMVHGRANYNRLCLTINYFFYKNALLVMTQFWFCLFNRFTGQSLYEKWTLSCYNLVFTSLPIIMVGIFDRDILNTDNILALPQLYQAGIRGDGLNIYGFIRWLLNAVAHSAIIFFVIMFGWGGDGINNSGTTGGLDAVGLITMSTLVGAVNCKLAIHANTFAWIQHLFLWGSILVFFFFCVVIGAFPISVSTIMYGNVQNVLTFPTPWMFYFLTIALTLGFDFIVTYAKYNFLKMTPKIIIQLWDSKDPMASIRPPSELRKKKQIPQVSATAITTNTQKAPSKVVDTSSATPETANLQPVSKDAKQQLFKRAERDEDEELDISQDLFMQFVDTEIEDSFLVYYYSTGFRYKFALGLCAVVSLILLAVSISTADKYDEPLMWGISSLVCWIGFFVVTFVKSLDLRGPLHRIILALTIIMFSSLSVANLLASQHEPKTHPVTMATIMLGLITVLRPPFWHGLQYSFVAILSFVGFSFAVKVDEWRNIDIALRAIEIVVVIITAMIALVMSESFTRKMFISQLQAKLASKAARREENRSLVLLGNVLPSAIVFEVRTNNHKLNQFSIRYDLASTLNSDIVKFTNFSSTKEPYVVVEMLNKMFTLFDAEAKALGLEKIKTVGDAYVCAGGVPVKDPLHQEKIMYMGMRMIANIHQMNKEGLTTLKDLNIQIRVGVATGSVSAGVVGMQKVCYEVFGECAEMSELMEQTGRPDEVHVHPLMANEVTRKIFNFKVIDGETFVAGLKDQLTVETAFGADVLASSQSTLGTRGMAEAMKSQLQLNRNDIYSFLEDEDLERRATIKLWGKFQGEMKVGILDFKNDLAESEFRHYVRLLSLGRFTPEAAQGTYLFLATTLLFGLYYETIKESLTAACLVIGALHLVILVLYTIYWLLRRHRYIASLNSSQNSSAGSANGGTSAQGAPTTANGGASTQQSNANGGNISDNDADEANAMEMIHRVSRRRATHHKRHSETPSPHPNSSSTKAPVPSIGSSPMPGDPEQEANTTVSVPIGENNQQGNPAHEHTSFDVAQVDDADAYADEALPLCTPQRFFAFVSGLAALTIPVVAFYVFDNISVVNVFVILSAQCYVLTFLHVRILFKFALSILHACVVVGSFFYATMVNDDSFTVSKDGGNIAALILCYVLNFISAYITEQNVRKTFAAAKNLLYQNAETDSSIALCDKILNNVLPMSIVQRMKEFPDRQIVDEVPDASVLFVYTDGLKHEHHAHKQKVAMHSSANTGVDANEALAAEAPEMIDSMNTFLWILDAITVKYQVEKIKTAPFLVVSGCPERRADHPERLAMVAMEIIAAVKQFNVDTNSDFKIKVGIHSGKVTAGVLGSTKFLYDVFGDTVNFASRLTSSAAWGTIQISAETAKRLHSSGFKVENFGTVELKGKGVQQIYLLKGKRANKAPMSSFNVGSATAVFAAPQGADISMSNANFGVDASVSSHQHQSGSASPVAIGILASNGGQSPAAGSGPFPQLVDDDNDDTEISLNVPTVADLNRTLVNKVKAAARAIKVMSPTSPVATSPSDLDT